jgi:hypothetical protein
LQNLQRRHRRKCQRCRGALPAIARTAEPYTEASTDNAMFRSSCANYSATRAAQYQSEFPWTPSAS